jgi:hypothetical protein
VMPRTMRLSSSRGIVSIGRCPPFPDYIPAGYSDKTSS